MALTLASTNPLPVPPPASGELRSIARVLGGEVSGRQVLAPGPGHSPKDRSLSIKIDPAAPGGFVANSFAGDDALACKDYVRGKLHLPAWQPKTRHNGHAGRSTGAAIGDAPAGDDPESAPAPAATQTWICDYDYRDIDGKLVYQVQRFDPKTFKQRRPDGRGGWITREVFEGVSRVLYRWPELAAEMADYPDAPIFCTEGEKDCDNVRALDLFATCVAGNVWTPEIAAVLKDRDVIFLEDNDKTGRDKAARAGQALHGIANSIRVASFSDMPENSDVSNWIALDPERHNAEVLVERCRNAPLFDPKAELPPGGDPSNTPLPFVDTSTWRVNEGVPPREWGVLDLFPRRNVSLLSGEGAAGKTLLQLQLGVAHALGRDWIGALPEPGPFLYFGAEDETDEIHRRLADILRSYGADFPDLQGKVHLLTFAGEDAVLGHADRTGMVRPTPLFQRLLAAASDIKPVLIGIDTAADVFAGNENDRAQVRQFVGMLRKMAIQANGYVIVNSHPSLTGISTGTGLSGSTGWHNSVRSRAYLTTAKTDKDKEPDPSLRILEFKKSNYGPIAKSITLRWDQGVYKPVAGVTSLDKMAKEQTADQRYLECLDAMTLQGRHVCHAPGRGYAPKAFADMPQANGMTWRAFQAAQERLFAAGIIDNVPYGPPSKGTKRIARKAVT
jgi:RecA-family ATPase